MLCLRFVVLCLHCVVLCCAVLCCVLVWCGVVWCNGLCCAALCCVALCCAVPFCSVLCCVVLCCAGLYVLCSAVLYFIVLKETSRAVYITRTFTNIYKNTNLFENPYLKAVTVKAIFEFTST